MSQGPLQFAFPKLAFEPWFLTLHGSQDSLGQSWDAEVQFQEWTCIDLWRFFCSSTIGLPRSLREILIIEEAIDYKRPPTHGVLSIPDNPTLLHVNTLCMEMAEMAFHRNYSMDVSYCWAVNMKAGAAICLQVLVRGSDPCKHHVRAYMWRAQAMLSRDQALTGCCLDRSQRPI